MFPDKSKQGGGPLIDIGTHALDITLWMMDNYEVESVTGSVFEKLGHMKEATVGNMFGLGILRNTKWKIRPSALSR